MEINYEKKYKDLIDDLKNIPTVGQKTAERIFDILLSRTTIISNLITSLNNIKEHYSQCPKCFCLRIENECVVCDDPNRDQAKICIVTNIRDFITLDRTKIYGGSYHILNGELALKRRIGPDNLTINELIDRIKADDISEVIFALNSTFEGEATLAYIKKLLDNTFENLKITRIAQGIPMGGTLEYIDELTLKKALEERKKI